MARRLNTVLPALATLGLLTISPPAQAQSCAPIESAFEALRDAYGEAPQVEWTDPRGNRFVLLANPQAGTMTIIAIPADRPHLACLVTAGTEYRKAGPVGRAS